MTLSGSRSQPRSSTASLLEGYRPLPPIYDEFYEADGTPRPDSERVVRLMDAVGETEFRRRQRLAEVAFLKGGITFSVYSDRRGVEKTLPFDLIPRVITAGDWERLEAGLVQRMRALNAFLADVYGEQRILAEGVVPRDLVESASGFVPSMRGIRPPGGIHVHVAGIDLLRQPDGEFLVLEDNARVPSGVSYVLENRHVMKRIFPRVFEHARVRAVDDYPVRLREALESVSPVDPEETSVVVLTPGPYNSAYFEHSYLARHMGCPLVEGRDLFVWQDRVYVKTTRGPQPVHVIYRRVDDEFLDPEAFHAGSMLGVQGLMRAYCAGNVALANAIGNGVADDKAMYALVPDMVRFYLSEEPILSQVETFLCGREKDRKYVLEHLSELVVKETDSSGGHGMLIGPCASRREISAFSDRIRARPRTFIAQPLIELSTCPTWTGNAVAPRRVDLRPYVVSGRSTWVLPGGLTRVALVEGSYVVNSSQGGGSKDTWVLEGSGRA